jgi:hypothetical protein
MMVQSYIYLKYARSHDELNDKLSWLMASALELTIVACGLADTLAMDNIFTA